MQKKLLLNKYGYYELKIKPDIKKLPNYYKEQYYQHQHGNYLNDYQKFELHWMDLKLKEKRIIAESIIGKKNNKKFLDIGCGEGFALKHFYKKGYNVLGLDFSSDAIKKHNPGYKKYLVEGDIYKSIEELRGTFDIILMQNTLEHVFNPGNLLKKIKKLSNKKTLLIVEVPNDFSYLQEYLLKSKKIKNKFWVNARDHISYFNKEGLGKLARHCGWQIQKIISDYPIDINLFNRNTNYNLDPKIGRSCHVARMEFEKMMHQNNLNGLLKLYDVMGEIGLGRNIVMFLN